VLLRGQGPDVIVHFGKNGCALVDLAAGRARSKKIVCVPPPRPGGVSLSACACLLLEDSMHVRVGGG
jgi:hypothetical protein